MRKHLSLAVIFTAFIGSSAFGQDWAQKMFDTTEHDFGTVARAAKSEFDFTFSNPYVEDIHIQSARSSCGCTSVEVLTPELKTYQKGAIRATFNTASFLGDRGATLTIVIDRPYYAEVQLHVKGTIRGDVVVDPGSVELGEVERGTAIERRVALTHSGNSDWQITGIKSADPNVAARVVETRRDYDQVSYVLAVVLKPNAPVGYLNEHLLVQTNDPSSPEIPLLVEGRVISGITVSPASLFMGIVTPGQEVSKPLVVKGTKPFRILSIQCDDKSFVFGKEKDDSAKTVHVIPVKFIAGKDTGKVTRTIRIETDLGHAIPTLPAYAVVNPANTTSN